MKRYAVFAVLTLFIVTGAVTAYAVERHHSAGWLTIDPSDMKEGETKTFTDDGRKVTVKRDGDKTHITIEGAEGTRRLTITSDGSEVRVDRSNSSRREIIVGPDRSRITIDGTQRGKAQTWFVCPKDHTILRVPEDKSDETFKCPVDGTTMEKRKGRGFAFFYDDSSFESHDM